MKLTYSCNILLSVVCGYPKSIIPYRLLLQLFEVFSKHFDDLVQEEEDFGGVGVAFCEGEKVEVVVSDVEILRVVEE